MGPRARPGVDEEALTHPGWEACSPQPPAHQHLTPRPCLLSAPGLSSCPWLPPLPVVPYLACSVVSPMESVSLSPPFFLHTLPSSRAVALPYYCLMFSADSSSPGGRTVGLSHPWLLAPAQKEVLLPWAACSALTLAFSPTGHPAVLRGEAAHGRQHRGPPGLRQVPGW